MNGRIVIIAEHTAAGLSSGAFELAGCAARLAALTGNTPSAILLGEAPTDAASELAAATGFDVLAMQSSRLADTHAETRRAALAAAFQDAPPTFILAMHNTLGAEIAPGLAFDCGGACLTAINAVDEVEGELRVARFVYQGKFVQWREVAKRPAVFTVQPGAFARLDSMPGQSGRVTIRKLELPEPVAQLLRVEQADEAADLNAADVIVAVGRGLGEPTKVELVERLAAHFSKGAVAGSRPVCDAGWLPYRRQVGQTGATVRPKAYLACGISGSTQHVLGMRDAEFIVAVNHDPHGPIFSLADVGIVADVPTLLRALLAELEK
jgi:electron transfer flavoprotein alpha subunit